MRLISLVGMKDFESILQDRSFRAFGVQINTIEQLCTACTQAGENTDIAISIVQGFLIDVPGLSSGTLSNITSCLDRVFFV